MEYIEVDHVELKIDTKNSIIQALMQIASLKIMRILENYINSTDN